jgi:parallel beta-helix repeat protein
MSSRSIVAAVFLTSLLLCGLASGQPPTNLLIPVNHTATGVGFGRNSFENWTDLSLSLFNAKDQPSTGQQRAYYYFRDVSPSLTQQWVHNLNNINLSLPAYPSVISHGGRRFGTAISDALAAVIGPQRYVGQHSQDFTNFYWTNTTPFGFTGIITCAATPHIESDETSGSTVVGLSRIGVPGVPTAYFQKSEDCGLTWADVPNGALPNQIPEGQAIVNAALESALGGAPNKLIVVTTDALNPVQNGELPLLTGHTVVTGVYYTSNLQDGTPLWGQVPIVTTDVLWNMKVAMKDDILIAIAWDATLGSPAVFRSMFNNTIPDPLVPWPGVPPASGIPYSLEFGPTTGGIHSLLSTSSAGLYYSPDDGHTWFPAHNLVGNVITMPEFRQMAVAPEDATGPIWKIALAGWYASYVGKFNAADWRFDLTEVGYDPQILNLYQNYNRAWSATSLTPTANGFTDVALVDHSTDEFFPDNRPVVVQVNVPDAEGDSHQKTIFLGDEQTEEEIQTRPFLFGQGDPAVVFNREGPDGPVVREAQPPQYTSWTEQVLFNDPAGNVAKVYDIAERPGARFISFDGANPGDRIWRNLGTGWEAAGSAGLEPFPQGYIAAAEGALYFLYPGGGRHLNLSTDEGGHFTELMGQPPDWGDIQLFHSIAVGRTAGMPLYLAGALAAGNGRIYRRNPDGIWGRIDWGASYGEIRKVVADPEVSDFCWIYTYNVAAQVSRLWKLSFPDQFHAAKVLLWQSPAGGYEVKDIKVLARDAFNRVLDLTIQPPSSNAAGVDHTIVKRWEFNVFDPAVGPLPAVLAGNWYLTGDVTIPAGQTVAIDPGSHLMFTPGSKLIVKGTLQAGGASGNEITFAALSDDAALRWRGIEVTGAGSANLSYCTLSEAAMAVNDQMATSLTVDHCTIENDSVGIYIYSPAGYGTPSISNSEISGCTAEGISMLSSPSAIVSNCQIHDNGSDGILLTSASPKISECHFTDNSSYGVNCYGSSPILYCNDFERDVKGEMLLLNGSYPVLWAANGGNGGANTFVNTNITLIDMQDSYPICAYGGNEFTIYGSGGYFMSDVSKKTPVHDIQGNAWSPSPPTAGTFWPSNLTYWKFSPTVAYGGCGSSRGSSGNSAQTLFEQGYTAEMAGNTAEAQSAYTQTVSQYPDSTWAQVAASRLLENQLQADSGLSVLQTYYATLQSAHPSDTALVKTAQGLANRTLVEQTLYGQALDEYQSIMSNPPSDVDSAYAALDFAVTVLRASYDSAHSRLDAALPVVSAQMVQDLRRAVQQVIPPVPQAHHENYLPAPKTAILEQNYPNPFNATTTLRYAVPASGQVRLSIYNIMGQKVATLVDAQQLAGYHSVSWNGTSVASGVYIYRLEAAGQTLTHKMLLLK